MMSPRRRYKLPPTQLNTVSSRYVLSLFYHHPTVLLCFLLSWLFPLDCLKSGSRFSPLFIWNSRMGGWVLLGARHQNALTRIHN